MKLTKLQWERLIQGLRKIPVAQHAPHVFDDTVGHLAFYRHTDGLPVAVALSRAFVRPPTGTYPSPITRRDFDLFKCTLPEVTL